jgi:hypothetical protein
MPAGSWRRKCKRARHSETGSVAGMEVCNEMCQLSQRDIDLQPPGGSNVPGMPMSTSVELVKGLEKSVADARAALQRTNEDHLLTPWRLLVAGRVVLEAPRHEVLRDTINHWSHHRGQMTVYLRLLGATVPALYGPSVDDQRFV